MPGGSLPIASRSNDTPAATGAGPTDPLKLIEEFVRIAATPKTTAPPVVPALPGGPIAPSIEGVSINFSPEDMAAALQVLQGKTQDAQMRVAQEGLQTSKTKLDEQNTRAMNKIQEWIKASQDAAAKEKVSSVTDWFAKIGAFLGAVFAVVAAAVATVATGGAAAPLLAVATLGLVGAGMSLASAISQELGGPALDVNSLMTQMCSAILTAVGVPADKVEAASKVMAGALAVLVPALLVSDPSLLGNLAGGIAQLAGADATTAAIVGAVFAALATIAVMGATMIASGGASGVDGIAKTIQTCSKAAQAVVGIVSGTAAAVTGGYRIAASYDEHKASMAQADKKVFDAVIARLGKQMEDDREELKKVIQQLLDGVSVVSQMINAAAENRAQLAQAVSARGPSV